MNLSDHISRLANEYDPLKEADNNASRSLLQGALVGVVMSGQIPLKVSAVEQQQDVDGNYLPYFIVEAASGARLRVSVEVEK